MARVSDDASRLFVAEGVNAADEVYHMVHAFETLSPLNFFLRELESLLILDINSVVSLSLSEQSGPHLWHLLHLFAL